MAIAVYPEVAGRRPGTSNYDAITESWTLNQSA
jgi:hypothetical protein